MFQTVFLALALAAAQPAPRTVDPAPTLTVPAAVEVDPGELFTLKAQTNCAWVKFHSPTGGFEPFPIADLIDAPLKVGAYVGKAGKIPGTYKLIAFAGNAAAPAPVGVTAITVKGAVPPPTPPPGPEPPDPPAPAPVTSLRVILVRNPTAVLTAGQMDAVYGQAVRDWLKTNTTPTDGGPGAWWADAAAPGDNLPQTWKALWAAVQPKLTTTPCVAIEVNGKATIEPLPGSGADMLKLLTKYAGK